MSKSALQACGAIAAAFLLLTSASASAQRDDVSIDAVVPDVIEIAAGSFFFGSDRAEREAAYQLDEAAYGHSVTRKNEWYEVEYPRQSREAGRYFISRNLITNAQYAAFVRATGHRHPEVSPSIWRSYRLTHPWERTRRHAWQGGHVPEGRSEHPVVLVEWHHAVAFAAWLSQRTGATWRLPTEAEWEKAARGVKGYRFPWGNDLNPALLNSHDRGPFDTIPVGQFPAGASSFGLLDPAGQVFEWTATETPSGRIIVKGGSWDDKGCGVCRPAARHTRPKNLRHILVGFRLVREPSGSE